MVEFREDDFKIIGCEDSNKEEINRPNISYLQDAWRRLKKNPVAMVSLVVIILLIIMVAVGPYINGKPYLEMDTTQTNLPPNGEFIFGTDSLGRDMFARLWFAGRISIVIALVSTLIQMFVGCLYGGIMAFFGGWVDEIMMRIIEILSSVPDLLVTILIIVRFGNSYATLVFALTFVSWVNTARLIRGQLMQLRESEYVLAAQMLGASPMRIIVKHFIPNTVGVLILTLATAIPRYIFNEAGLSFLGIGLQPPMTSWGVMISMARETMQFFPYQLYIPSIALCITVLAFNLLGDGLRDALDPRLRQ